MWTALALALADDVYIPVTGALTDAAGLPMHGDATLQFRLYDAASATPDDQVFDESSVVHVERGQFTAMLGVDSLLPSAEVLAGPLYLTTTIAGVETAPVPVGWAPRALHAANADTLAGQPASAYQYSAGAGLALSGTSFSADLGVLDDTFVTRAGLAADVGAAPITLAAGSTVAGQGLITAGNFASTLQASPVTLAAGSTLAGQSLITSGNFTSTLQSGPVDLAAGSSMAGAGLLTTANGQRLATLTRAPTAADTGFPTGTVLTNTAAKRLYVNTGTSSSPAWQGFAPTISDPVAQVTYTPPLAGAPYRLPNSYNGTQGLPNPNTPTGTTVTFNVTQRSRWLVKFSMPSIITWSQYSGSNHDSFRARVDGADAAVHFFYANRGTNPQHLQFENTIVLDPGSHTLSLWYQTSEFGADKWTIEMYNPIVITATPIAIVD
jgi:hypothetical protein